MGAIVQAFSSIQDDLLKVRKATMKLCDRRKKPIKRVIGETDGMYGSHLERMAGNSLQEIDSLELAAHEASGDQKKALSNI